MDHPQQFSGSGRFGPTFVTISLPTSLPSTFPSMGYLSVIPCSPLATPASMWASTVLCWGYPCPLQPCGLGPIGIPTFLFRNDLSPSYSGISYPASVPSESPEDTPFIRSCVPNFLFNPPLPFAAPLSRFVCTGDSQRAPRVVFGFFCFIYL